MLTMKKIAATLAALALLTTGLMLGAPAKAAAAEPGTGGGSSATDIAVPIAAVVAIAAFAGLAIWQNISDGRKKKKKQMEEEAELKESDEFDKYFQEEKGKDDAEEDAGAETVPTESGATEIKSPDTPVPAPQP